METVRVALADDHVLVRAGVRQLLASHGITVVSEAGDGRALMRCVRDHLPEVAIVDISMPLLDGIEATRRISKISPETRVVLLTMHDDERFAQRAIAAGVWGYVKKDDAIEHLVEVVRRVADGERCLPEGVESESDRLTTKEREVLQLILEGKKNRDIAEIMSRSVHTVRAHRARLMRKLGARSATDLLDEAESLGLVS
ncbi:MAG: response regulator transcription factor [Candidatus Bipolaricaulota bacterium]|nr:MAG: response regulator transcription factor [Candidatus Bipolaricaulota bacterium]